MPKLSLNCREVTRLVLAEAEQPAGRWERALMRLHWLVCRNCKRFRHQAEVLRKSTDRWRAYREE